jgi:hypothetical protein
MTRRWKRHLFRFAWVAALAVAISLGSDVRASSYQYFPSGWGVVEPATSGHIVQLNSNDASCFYENYGAMANYYCASWVYWMIPVPINYSAYLDIDGDHNIVYDFINTTVFVYAPNSSDTVGCYQYGVRGSAFAGDWEYAQSSVVYPSTFGATTQLSLGNVPLDLGGTAPSPVFAQVVCYVYQYGVVYGINANTVWEEWIYS